MDVIFIETLHIYILLKCTAVLCVCVRVSNDSVVQHRNFAIPPGKVSMLLHETRNVPHAICHIHSSQAQLSLY